jgi:class 3 adenylate cyclase
MARQTDGPTSRRPGRRTGRPPELPQGIVTFLCTDIEGSSPLWELHRAAMSTALARHEALISTVVTAHSGRLIKSRGEGDSTLSVFWRASDAMTAALALQQALDKEVWPDGLILSTRVALHTGEAELRDGDYYGPTVNRAARLRALARGGQVLLSRVTAELVADQLPARAGLTDVGMQHLKGLSRAEHVLALVHPDLRAPSLALSPPMTRLLGGTFVGRDVELSQLGDALDSALGGQGRLVLVAGEAGIGKTRVTEELADRATARGVKVVWGRCSESEGASAYWPWIQVLRAATADLPPEALAAQFGQNVAAVAQLLPELAVALPSPAPPTVQEPESARLHLYQAMSDFLRRASRSTALLVVLDDLHWADQASLSLLEFVARELAGARVLLVATYRDVEVHRHHPLSDSLAELVRQPVTSRVVLRGLNQDQVRRCIAAIGGAEPKPELVTAVYDRTEGNPFFVGELVRLLASEGRLDRSGLLTAGVPEGVRQVIGRRLNRLSEPTVRILTVASVQGRDFDLDVVAHAADLGGEEVLDRLEEAINAHLVVEAGGSWGRYRFTHALVRETFYDELVALRRRRLHQRIGQALAELRAGRLEAHLAELAHHWDAAGDFQRALPAAIEAGMQAERGYAFAEAHQYYQRALDLWGRVPGAAELAPIDQVALLERAAEAAYLTGDDPRAVELLRAALDSVDRQRDPVRAALLLERLGGLLSVAWPTADQAAMAAYVEAVRLVRAEPPSAGQARVLAGYGDLLYNLSRYEEARRVAEEALTAARRVGARRAEGRALTCLGVACGYLGDPEQGLAHLLDARRIAEEQADVDGIGLAYKLLHEVNELAGRLNDALAAALDGAEATRRLGSPRWSTRFQGFAANFAFRLGRWEEADRLFRALLERRPLPPAVEAYARLERARLDIARGDITDMRRWLQEAEQLVRKAGRSYFDEMWGPMLAHAQAALALSEGSYAEAFQAATEGLAAKARAGDAVGRPELFALGMAAAAARAEQARAHHATAAAEAAGRDGAALLARLEALANRAAPASPELAAVLVQCRAEETRLQGRADPALWAAAAARWDALSQPYATTYARFREAEALLATKAPRAQVAARLRAAHAVAVRLGAAPLRRDLERLGQRSRIRLQAPAQPAQD